MLCSRIHDEVFSVLKPVGSVRSVCGSSAKSCSECVRDKALQRVRCPIPSTIYTYRRSAPPCTAHRTRAVRWIRSRCAQRSVSDTRGRRAGPSGGTSGRRLARGPPPSTSFWTHREWQCCIPPAVRRRLTRECPTPVCWCCGRRDGSQVVRSAATGRLQK